MQFLVTNSIINLDDVRESMRKKERQELLAMHEYAIFQGKDGRWRTTLKDETNKSGRRAVAKKDLKDLEDLLVEHYRQLKKEKLLVNCITLRTIYPLWLQSRKLEVNSIGTVKKNDQDWKRYYLNDPIIDKPLDLLTIQELKDWAHKKINDYNLNKRDYYNMAIVMKQCYSYAKDSGFIEENTWEKVKINTKKLIKPQKKSNETQIYFLDEQQAIINHALELFEKNPKNISALTIPLIFVTGLRIGEVVALKYDDIDEVNNIINVKKMESVIYELEEDGNFTYKGKEVVEHAKTEAGVRAVPLTSQAKQIIHRVKEASERFGFYDEGYIFCPRSKRIAANSIDKKIYNYCDAINMNRKSAHKIRKTYISKLIHSGQVDIDTICKVAGHVDMKTTFTSYCYSLDHVNEIQNKFEDVLRIE